MAKTSGTTKAGERTVHRDKILDTEKLQNEITKTKKPKSARGRRSSVQSK